MSFSHHCFVQVKDHESTNPGYASTASKMSLALHCQSRDELSSGLLLCSLDSPRLSWAMVVLVLTCKPKLYNLEFFSILWFLSNLPTLLLTSTSLEFLSLSISQS